MRNLIPGPRWRKVFNEIWVNKTRTILVALSLAVGVFTVSFLINAESLLRTAFDRQYAASAPSSATIIIPSGFDQDFVKSVRAMPAIEEADGQRSANVRLKVGPDQWIDLNVAGIDDFNDIRIDKVQPYSGAWPPARGELLMERSSLRLASMPDMSIGQGLTIQTADGKERTLKLAGLAYDFNRTPSPGTGVVYGYATLDTIEQLGEPRDMNLLRIIVAQNRLDKDHIRQVADQVKDKATDSGWVVGAINIPDPGQHPLGAVLDGLEIILGTLSALTLIAGVFLVFNSIVALLAQQVRQIGIMKAVGARTRQIAGMYLGMVIVFGVLALLVATPLATLGGIQFARFLGDFFNLDLKTVSIPASAFIVEALIGFGVPALAAIYPIWSGTRVTVLEAVSDYGLGRMDAKPGLVDRSIERLRGLFSRPVVLSLRNTFRRRARLALTLLPLALSGTLLIAVINVRGALQNELENIMAYKKYDFDIALEQPYLFAEIQNTALKVPGVTRIEGYHETGDAYRLRSNGSQANYTSVVGVSPSTSLIRLPVTDGRWLVEQDQAAAVINDAFQRNEPDIRLGDVVPFKIDGRKLTLRVVGVVREKMAPARLYLNDTYYSKMLGGGSKPNNVWLATDQRVEPADFKKALNAQFEQANLHVASVTPVSDQRDSINFHFSIMVVPLGMASFLLALVGGLGLMGTMSTAVLERQREIGVMRAIGAPDRGVRQLFIIEGLVIGLISWLISVAAAWPVSHFLDTMIGNAFLKAPITDVFSVGGVLVWLLIVVVTSVASCYLPAQNASQTSVRELLAYQ